MAKYIASQGCPYRVGYAMLPDRKRPSVVVEVGNHCEVYGQFKDEEAADKWFGLLCSMLSIKEEKVVVDGD